MNSEKRKQQEFFELAERFRSATDLKEAKRLGDQLGRMVFGEKLMLGQFPRRSGST